MRGAGREPCEWTGFAIGSLDRHGDIMRALRSIGIGSVLFALTAVLFPAVAQAAAPTVYCVIAYGHENPGICDKHPDLGAPVYRGKIYPTSRPYGYGEKGLLFVEGYATPGTRVTVSATDGDLVISRTVEATASEGKYKADLKVTELGAHEASGPNPFGHSVLTVTAVAVNGLGEGSAPMSREIDKYAVDGATDAGGSTLDIYSPRLSNLKWPPKHWCRTSTAGMGNSNVGNFGGDRDGKCSSLQMDGVGAVPDLSWLMCIEPTSEGSAVRSLLPAPLNTPNPFRSEYCRTPVRDAAPTGEAQISGLAEDDHSGAFGHASEISKVVIQIKQGTSVLKTITNFSRQNSTQGHWAESIRINDFTPNYPNGPAYSVTVTVTDAVGKTASASQTGITIYPW